jgi:hypothetical protein
MKFVNVAAVALCVVGLCAGWALSNGQNDGGEGFQIAVAANVIVLGSPADEVTVHSNIPAALVVRESVALNGVAPASIGADSTGCLTARIPLAALPGIAPPSATITLTCELTDGSSLALSDTVKVVTIGKK